MEITREQIEDSIRSIISSHLQTRLEDIRRETALLDLGADSLDVLAVMMAFEEQYGLILPAGLRKRNVTFGQVVDTVYELLAAQPGRYANACA
jgi:acyl carrier protein